MELQVSVFLLFVLFTAGHSLRCYAFMTGSWAGQTVKTCPSGYSKCMSSTDGYNRKVKDCVIDCYSGSTNTGDVRNSVVCCDTDLCNIQDAPDHRYSSPNGKKCYSCDGKSCSNIISCSGIEDRCITATGTSKDELRVTKGCISKSKCDAITGVSTAEVITCCEGNLCNGAQSVTQSFLFLCCSLLSYFLLH